MTAQKKREILTGGIAALLIVCAVAARVVTRGHREAPYFLPVSLLRSFIYIGLMMWWGISLWQRIVQTQVRRYLAATAALCVFWLSIRTVKFFIAATPAAIRYLWYGYYVPMLFIPLLCVLVALSLGRPENYRLPRWTNLLYLPTALLLLQVLTNDLHHKAYLEMHRPILFNELVLSDKLFEHCAEIDEAARNRMELIVRSLAERNGVTEQLKAENQMEWVRQMNACKAQAEEVVKAELIYD